MSATALKEKSSDLITPNWRQHAEEVQKYGTVIKDLPIGLSEDVRSQSVKALNQLLADTATLRDLYKKSHWQAGGPTFLPASPAHFYQPHLLFEKHFGEQVELVDVLAERIQMLGGVSIAMAADIAGFHPY